MRTTKNKRLFYSEIQLDGVKAGLGSSSLLPQAHGEDYEEELFANRMKKKKKGRG